MSRGGVVGFNMSVSSQDLSQDSLKLGWLGCGYSGKVWKVEEDDTIMVMKIIDKVDAGISELTNLRRLRNAPHVVKLIKAFIYTPNHHSAAHDAAAAAATEEEEEAGQNALCHKVGLYFPYQAGFMTGDAFLARHETASDHEVRVMLRQIRTALHYMTSELNMYHMDIKADNVLYHPVTE